MRKRKSIISIILMVALTALYMLAPASAFAEDTSSTSTDVIIVKDIYVSTSGDDLNSGLSQDLPKKSIPAALKVAMPGDRVLLMPGTYYGSISISKNGEPDMPITITSYSSNPDELAIIDGKATVPAIGASNLWLKISNSSWLVFESLKFQNGWEDPITIKDSSYLTFNKCSFSGGRRVIYAKGPTTHHILIQNNYWDQGGNTLWTMETAPNGLNAWDEMHHGSLAYFNGSLFYPKGTGGSHVIRGNTVVNAFNGFRWKGVDANEIPTLNLDTNIEIYDNVFSNIRDNDIEPEASTYNLHIYHNRSNNIHKTMSVDGMIGGYIYYYGNVVTADTQDPWADSIATGWWKVYNALSFPMFAFNNSFYGNSRPFNAMATPAKFLKHFNNAYSFTGGDRTWVLDQWDATMEFDNDISSKAWPANIINNNQEQSGIIADPGYIDGPNHDLRLTQSSPGIDAGRIMEFPEFNWKQSYDGTAPDIGAYENGKLVEGPPFKFMSPPGGVAYTEKPRIVRHRFENGNLRLYFSADLNPDSIKASEIHLKSARRTIPADKITFTGTREILIKTSEPLPEDTYIIEFKRMPTGTNGEAATFWGSTIECKIGL